jgi:hypothetical protein
LLPALLVAPVERDIRIINIINPFYAAAIPTFSPSFAVPSTTTTSPPPHPSKFILEGTRALRTAIFTRHLQRILDALPSSGQLPKTDDHAGSGSSSSAIPIVSDKSQKSNIVAISVCPGISRADTIAPLLNADLSVEGASVGAIM